MSSASKQITEGFIRTDLNDIVHSLAAELAMACKKMSIYSEDHPVGRRSLEKPFLLFGRLFGFRRYVSVAVQKGNLYICNISLKEAGYYSPIIQAMQVLDISAMLFERTMSIRDFGIFGKKSGWTVIFGGNSGGKPRVWRALSSW